MRPADGPVQDVGVWRSSSPDWRQSRARHGGQVLTISRSLSARGGALACLGKALGDTNAGSTAVLRGALAPLQATSRLQTTVVEQRHDSRSPPRSRPLRRKPTAGQHCITVNSDDQQIDWTVGRRSPRYRREPTWTPPLRSAERARSRRIKERPGQAPPTTPRSQLGRQDLAATMSPSTKSAYRLSVADPRTDHGGLTRGGADAGARRESRGIGLRFGMGR